MLKTTISIVVSLVTLKTMQMAGQNDQRFNYLGLVNCCLWTLFTFLTGIWAMMILNVSLTYIYLGNIRDWKKGAAEQRGT